MSAEEPFDGIVTLRAQEEHLKAKLTAVQARIIELENLPEEPMIGAMVRFTKFYELNPGVAYIYGAIRGTHGKWSVTGAKVRHDFTWGGLVRFAEGAPIFLLTNALDEDGSLVPYA